MRWLPAAFLTWLIPISFCQTTSNVNPPPIAPSQTISGGSLEGYVTDANTGLAVFDLPVTLTLVETGIEHATKTDGHGRYFFPGPIRGGVKLHTPREQGYLASGRTIRIENKERSRWDFQVRKGGVLVGRITNADKEPVKNAVIQARREGHLFGRPMLLTQMTRTTNDQGEYRIDTLDPGDYVVQVIPKRLEVEFPNADSEDVTQREPKVSNAVTYYLNSPDRLGATLVRVDAGGVETRADFSVLSSPSVCITAKLELPAGPLANPVGVVMGEPYPLSDSKIAVGIMRKEGLLQICGVTRGTYFLRATTSTQSGDLLMGVQTFTVSGSRGMKLPSLAPMPLTDVSGSVRVESEEGTDKATLPEPTTGITISLEPTSRSHWQGETLSSQLRAPGVFSMRAAIGDFWTQIHGLPGGYFVKDVTCNGKDALRHPISTGSGPITVTLANYAATVTGTTTDPAGRGIGRATVLLLNSSASSEIAPTEMLYTVSDSGGRFSISGVPPGEYFMAAYLDMPYRQEYSVAVRESLRRSGLRVRLGPREQRAVNVTPSALSK